MEPARRALPAALLLLGLATLLLELLLTRLFAIVLFAQFAHLALAVALLGIAVGALAQHLRPGLVPADRLERRLGLVAALWALAALVAVVATVRLPLTVQFDVPPLTYQERSRVREELLRVGWFSALLPLLALPFALTGLFGAAAFRHRRARIGALYAADLLGGAAGALVFLPLLGVLAGPDLVFVAALAALAAAALLFRAGGARGAARAALAGVLVAAGAAGVGASGADLLRVRAAAGYSEDLVTFSVWTPLARVSVHEDPRRGTYVLLDNTSASEVFRSEERAREVARTAANRALVYRVLDPTGPVAVLAASAGPEVAIARLAGFRDIDAVDIAGEIFDVVRDRFPNSPVNPYRDPEVHTLRMDGRAAILHARRPYAVIQMVHANLWSSAGLVANAWSPSLLETREAFAAYLDHLRPDGVLSFGRGPATDAIARAAAAALVERGVAEPWRHLFYARADSSVLLVRPRPWTREERDRAVAALRTFRHPRLVVDPLAEPTERVRRLLLGGPVMTDDRPYLDDPDDLWRQVRRALAPRRGRGRSPLAVLYRSLLVQAAFVVVAGLLFVGLPFALRGPGRLRGAAAGLAWAAGLGYGYLAVETVLVQQLVLFVGHPVYAVTVVVLALLLASGAGSRVAGMLPEGRRLAALRWALAAVLGLAALQALAVPGWLLAHLSGAPPLARMGLVLFLLFPLGFAMGMPFPLGVRLLRDEAAPLVPWAWAMNGWASVAAALVTVLVSRLWGYSRAFGLALLAYAVALALAGALPRIRPAAGARR